MGALAKAELTFGQSPVSANQLGELIDAVASREITSMLSCSGFVPSEADYRRAEGTTAKILLRTYIAAPTTTLSSLIASNSTNCNEMGTELAELCRKIVIAHPSLVAKIKAGQIKVIMRLVGAAMKESGGRLDAKQLAATFTELIEEQEEQ